MKKLINISSQIKNNTFSYTGKGSFEAAVNNHKDLVISWLEELKPLQKQIEMLYELTQLEFQKRNYTRILTKTLPLEYQEFVCVNILVRDANIVAQYYSNQFNLTLLYEELIENRYLKYPGKNEKYVDYKTFQQFVMMYKDDLSISLEKQPTITKEIDDKTVESAIEITEEVIEVKPEKTNWTQLLLGKGK